MIVVMGSSSTAMSVFQPIEKELHKAGYKLVAGLDEAGRGPWAGPVVASAVILKNKAMRMPGLKDSKQLTAKQRMAIFGLIKRKIYYGTGLATNSEIDRYGLIKATNLAFVRAIQNLPIAPDFLVIDGRDKFEFEIPYRSYIRGDECIQSVCLASIIAKVTRDEIMCTYNTQFPEYGFDRHKGYGTHSHIKALKKYGPCVLHRRSYKPIAELIHHA